MHGTPDDSIGNAIRDVHVEPNELLNKAAPLEGKGIMKDARKKMEMYGQMRRILKK